SPPAWPGVVGAGPGVTGGGLAGAPDSSLEQPAVSAASASTAHNGLRMEIIRVSRKGVLPSVRGTLPAAVPHRKGGPAAGTDGIVMRHDPRNQGAAGAARVRSRQVGLGLVVGRRLDGDALIEAAVVQGKHTVGEVVVSLGVD